MAAPPSADDDDAVCVDCQDAKSAAASRAAAEPKTRDGLQLGECAPLYRTWADCIAAANGQAKDCADVLKAFRACHDAKLAGKA